MLITIRGARRASPTASSCCSATRIARSGTREIAAGLRRSTARSRWAAAGRTCSRRRSPRCTSRTRATGAVAALYEELARAHRLAGGRAQPRGRRSRGGRRRGRRWRSSTRLELDRYHYLHATRARAPAATRPRDEARAAYDRALELVTRSPSGAFSSSAAPSSRRGSVRPPRRRSPQAPRAPRPGQPSIDSATSCLRPPTTNRCGRPGNLGLPVCAAPFSDFSNWAFVETDAGTVWSFSAPTIRSAPGPRS